MTYLENVTNTLIAANKFSMSQHQRSAWNNKKINSRNLYLPRGNCFQRLERIEGSAAIAKFRYLLANIPQ